MKVSRLAAILIVIGIMISASVVVFVYGMVQNNRIALISVRADKPSYGAGENVTFQLIDTPQT